MIARLAGLGHEVIHAANGKIAVDLFSTDAPDLIIMDVEMPIMNGFEATTRIRAEEATRKWAWTPIIFLTSTDTQDNLLTAIEAGGDDFLPKSVAELVLFAKMKAMSRIALLRKELSIANQKLEELAIRDQLTGLANRRYLDIQLDALWEASRGNGTKVALIMMDVDNFKKYNDFYGHSRGDDCLIKTGKALEDAVKKTNSISPGTEAFVARYGGEEFTIIVSDASMEKARLYSEAALDSVRSQKIQHEQNDAHGIVTISAGIKVATPASSTIATSFRQADSALYQSKEQGRNRMTFA